MSTRLVVVLAVVAVLVIWLTRSGKLLELAALVSESTSSSTHASGASGDARGEASSAATGREDVNRNTAASPAAQRQAGGTTATAAAPSAQPTGGFVATPDELELVTPPPRTGPGTERDSELTPEQAEMLVMYETIANVFDRPYDCEQISVMLNAVIGKHEDVVKGWAKAQTGIGSQGAQSEQETIEDVAAPRLQHIRDSMRKGLQRCGNSRSLSAAIARLAVLGTGV